MLIKGQDVTKPAAMIYYYLSERREIVEWVSDRELKSCKKIGLPENIVIEAIKELEEKKLIESRIKGSLNLYTVNTEIQKDTEALKEEMLQYIKKHKEVSYNYKELKTQFQLTKTELKALVNQLVSENLICIKNLKSTGPALCVAEGGSDLNKEPILYLVDTENASNPSFYKGLEHLRETDQVLLIMSQNSRGFLTPQLAHRLFNCSAKIESIFSDTKGKNSLDFVLVSEASLRLASNPTQKLCIISGDYGFDGAISHLVRQLNLSKTQLIRRENFI